MKLTPPQIYARSLYSLGRGCPLYVPEPNDALPAEYKDIGTSPGDLGIVRPDGGFDFLLNVRLPADHPINSYYGVPADFQTIDDFIHERRIRKIYPANKPILSKGARTKGLGFGGQASVGPSSAGVEMTVMYERNEGAIVFPPAGVDSVDCGKKRLFQRYAEKHAQSLYRWVNEALEMDIENGELYLITGADKTDTWWNGVFSSSSKASKCELIVSTGPAIAGAAGVGGHFRMSDSSQHDWLFGRESPLGNDKQNQTLFLRGFRISIVDKFWGLGKLAVEVSDTSSFSSWEELTGKRGGMMSFNRRSSASTSGSSHSTENKSPTSRSANDALFSDQEMSDSDSNTTLEADSEEDQDTVHTLGIYHPLMVINGYIGRTRNNVEVVITHDDDWIALLDDEDTEMPDNATLVGRLESRMDIHVRDGKASIHSKRSEIPNTDHPKVTTWTRAKLSPGRRKMLDLINRLLNTGVQLDIDIPRIAVIGNQSAGKSSLIEAISGITLPRASGTCTRCPTECRLMNSEDPWKCIVSIRILTDSTGQPLGQPKNEPFGETIYSKAEVEQRIKLAQFAILNPHVPRKALLDGSEEPVNTTRTNSFSANCVSLEISGPDVADLSFCDLPGLIQSMDDGNSRDIELIQRMAESYIKKLNCIILLTVSCETDYENQGASQLAKKYDPKGERTVGVLTKPDRIDRGDESTWLDVIRGEKEALRNHWFCVKQPSTSELNKGITWEQARQKESDFFSSTAPWCDLDPMYQKHFRTGNLVDRLSMILSDLIAKRLPELRRELDNSIQKTRDALRQLPQAPSDDPLIEISTMLYKFKAAVDKRVEGIPTRDGLHQSIRPALEAFLNHIRRTAPCFVPFSLREREDREDDISFPKPDFIRPEDGANWDNDSKTNRVFLDEVLQRAKGARTRELPGNHPCVIEDSYVAEFTEHWEAYALEYCRETYVKLLDHVVDVVQQHFGEYGQGTLERQISNVVQNHLRKRFDESNERLRWWVQLERRPSTTNTHYFSDYRDKFLNYYNGLRQQEINPTLVTSIGNDWQQNADVQQALSTLSLLGFNGLNPSDLQRLRTTDEMEPALKIMAEVRAYFQVAYKRFTDNVHLIVDFELVQGLERDLLETLFERLDIHGPHGREICKNFAQEDIVNAERREELMNKLERLEGANNELIRM